MTPSPLHLSPGERQRVVGAGPSATPAPRAWCIAGQESEAGRQRRDSAKPNTSTGMRGRESDGSPAAPLWARLLLRLRRLLCRHEWTCVETEHAWDSYSSGKAFVRVCVKCGRVWK